MKFKILFIVLGCLLACSNDAYAQRLHIVYGYQEEGPKTNGNWVAWNKSIRYDNNFVNTIQESCPPKSVLLTHVVAKPGQQNKGSILQKIKKLKVSPGDAVMFYWSGHGAVDSKGHFLDLDLKERLYRTEIIDAISSTARLKVCFTNTCASIKEDQSVTAPAPTGVKVMNVSGIAPLIDRLFFKTSGVVDINTAKPGEVGCLRFDEEKNLFGSASGHALNDYFSKNMRNGGLDWPTVLTGVRKQVDLEFRKPCCFPEGVDGQRTQTVHAFQLPGQFRFGAAAVNSPNGVRITQVIPNSPAMRFVFNNQTGALEVGDEIVSINNKPIRSEQEFRHAIRMSGQDLFMTVINKNDGQRITGSIKLNY